MIMGEVYESGPESEGGGPGTGSRGCGSGPGSEWFRVFSRGNLGPDTVGF